MYLKLRILFAILSAICVGVAIPVGIVLGLTGVLICAGLAFAFYLMMLTFKDKHESLNPSQPIQPTELAELTEKKEEGEKTSSN